MHRLGLIEEPGIVGYGRVFGVDLGHWYLAHTLEIAGLGFIAEIESPAGSYGRDHVAYLDIGHAAYVETLVGITFDEKADYFCAQIGRREPEAIALLIARECAHTLAGTSVRSAAIEWWDVTHSAPGALLCQIRRSICSSGTKLPDPDLQPASARGIDVVGHDAYVRTHLGGHATAIKSVLFATACGADYVIGHVMALLRQSGQLD